MARTPQTLPEWATVGAKVLIRTSAYISFTLNEATVTRVTKTSVFVASDHRPSIERRFILPKWGRPDTLTEYGVQGSYSSHYVYLENGVGLEADWMRARVRVDTAKAKAKRLAAAWTGALADTSELRQALASFEVASSLFAEIDRNREAAAQKAADAERAARIAERAARVAAKPGAAGWDS